MPIRVIAGSAKGIRLKLVPGETTRPIMDRVKEALFSILGRDVVGATFLDLFAGTGSVGIEALSRGAKETTFVEVERKAVETIYENLKLTKLSKRAVVRRTDVFNFLKHPLAQPYDFIYVAPPQYKGIWLRTLETLDHNPDWISPQTRVIVQIDPSEKQTVSLRHMMIDDERRYGNTLLWFFTGRDTETSPHTEE
jgi:16S rRNA (guanine(966)-N(2))-methyltransferase RsmD